MQVFSPSYHAWILIHLSNARISHLHTAFQTKTKVYVSPPLGNEVTPRALRRKYPYQTQFGLYLYFMKNNPVCG